MTTPQALHDQVVAQPAPEWDPRLGHIMPPAAYENYHRSNAGHKYYVYLAKLVRHLGAMRVVELGTDIGRSALFMMTQLPKDGTLETIELGSQEAIDLIPFKNDPRLRIVRADDLSEECFRALNLLPDHPMTRPIDLLFADSFHTFEHTMGAYTKYRPFMRPGGLMVFDDIHLDAGMELFWRSVLEPKADCGLDIHFSGFGFVQIPS
jgi:predicted O-methyltransferase YrrM